MNAGRLGLLLLFAGCILPPGPIDQTRPVEFSNAEEAFLREDFPAAQLQFERFRNAHPSSQLVPWALYYEGRCLLVQGKPILARERFESAKIAFRDPTEQAVASFAIGDALLQQDRFEDAEKAYLSARGAGGVPTDEILFQSALCAQRLGRWKEADGRLREILEKYPDATAAPAAERVLARNRERYFSIQTGMFRVKDNADRSARAIRSAGLEPRVQPVGSPGQPLYRVCFGKFKDYREAKQEMSNLKRKGIISTALIIP
ncbi:MAG: SPOR domain-containing protein [Planctomycetota bacterium]|nr:SPOR domain-containing protein [Planctomycetota bacterium]